MWNYEWHETISLMAGLMEELIDLIQEILNEKDDIFHTQLLLAGRCLAECTESKNPLMTKIIEDTVDKIHQFWCCHPDAEFIQSVVIAIGKANLDQSRNFQKFLQHERPYVRAKAASVLSEIGTTDVVPTLLQAFQDEDSSVRLNGLRALGRISLPHFICALEQARQDENDSVRREAVEALGKIGAVYVGTGLERPLQVKKIEIDEQSTLGSYGFGLSQL